MSSPKDIKTATSKLQTTEYCTQLANEEFKIAVLKILSVSPEKLRKTVQ